MGELTCLYCGSKAEGKDFDEADAKIDHGAQSKRKCNASADKLVFVGTKKATVEIKTPKATTTVKAVVKKTGRK